MNASHEFFLSEAYYALCLTDGVKELSCGCQAVVENRRFAGTARHCADLDYELDKLALDDPDAFEVLWEDIIQTHCEEHVPISTILDFRELVWKRKKKKVGSK